MRRDQHHFAENFTEVQVAGWDVVVHGLQLTEPGRPRQTIYFAATPQFF